MIEERVRMSFGRQAMMETAGARLEHAADGVCRIAAPIRPELCQQHGYAHAALTFALGDSAAGYAALTTLPEGQEVLTAEMKINLLAPGRGERLVAEGRVVRSGRRLVVVTAEVRTEGEVVALLQGTVVPIAL